MFFSDPGSTSADAPWNAGDRADLLDDVRPKLFGQIVAHSGIGNKARTGDPLGSMPAGPGLDERVVLPRDDQRRRGDGGQRAELLRTTGGELALSGGGITRTAVMTHLGGRPGPHLWKGEAGGGDRAKYGDERLDLRLAGDVEPDPRQPRENAKLDVSHRAQRAGVNGKPHAADE